jgi:hypothetical protein
VRSHDRITYSLLPPCQHKASFRNRAGHQRHASGKTNNAIAAFSVPHAEYVGTQTYALAPRRPIQPQSRPIWHGTTPGKVRKLPNPPTFIGGDLAPIDCKRIPIGGRLRLSFMPPLVLRAA